MNKKVSFAERLALMQTAATSLRAIAEIVEQEASAVAEVQQRFAARKPAQQPAALSLRPVDQRCKAGRRMQEDHDKRL
jgi:hypothetical protein